jgi:hypothetical protein
MALAVVLGDNVALVGEVEKSPPFYVAIFLKLIEINGASDYQPY